MMLGHKLVRSIFIRTQASPNPQFIKFLPGQQVLSEGSIDFSAPREALNSPLALKLFQIEGVKKVVLGQDYVAIGKQESTDWAVVKPLVFEALTNHIASGEEVITDTPLPEDTKILETDSEIVATIKEMIEFRIKPFVQEDGGDVRYLGFDEENGVVQLEMRGSCVGCPSSSVTLRNGIERMLTHFVPQVVKVEAVDAQE